MDSLHAGLLHLSHSLCNAMTISNDRLRELANGATLYGHERNEMAAELLAARERIDELSDDSTSWESRAMGEKARAEKAEAGCAQWQSKWEHTIDNAVCSLSKQLQAAEREAVVKRDEATAWKAMADIRLAERDAARAEVERLRAELADLRAYRDRTEAALTQLWRKAGIDEDYVDADDLRDLGLARDAKGADRG